MIRSLLHSLATLMLLLFAASVSQVSFAKPSEDAITVYVNAKVFTADPMDRIADAFAVQGERFLGVGTRAAMKPYLKGAKVIDLKGAFVVPGLTDDHFHGAGGGDYVSLSQVRTMGELVEALRAEAARTPADGMVLTNGDWHEAQLKDERKPTIADLDQASATVPIIVVRGGHSIFLNSAALRKYNISTATTVPAGGSIERNADGSLTGELIDRAKILVPLPAPTPLSEMDLLETQRVMNSYGVVAVRVPGVFAKGSIPEVYTQARKLQQEGRLSLRYTLLRPGPGFAKSALDTLKTGPQQGDGDEWVRIGGVKIAVDGGFEGAHFYDPYEEPFGQNGTFRGIALVPSEQTRSDVVALHRAGWHVAVHAAGDAGIDQALAAFEAANAEKPISGENWSIEHGFIVTPDQMQRMKALGVAASLQDHQYLAASTELRMWGKGRADRVSPAKSYWDAGILVAGGTDAPVISANPFLAIYYFVSRGTIHGKIYGPSEALSRSQVLRMFTINYARLIGADAVRGSIEPSKLADFAVLDTDLLNAPVEGIRDARALATYVGGRKVYSASSGE